MMFDHTKSNDIMNNEQLLNNQCISTSQQSYVPSYRITCRSFISSKENSRDDKYATAITSGDQLQYSATSKVSHHVRSSTQNISSFDQLSNQSRCYDKDQENMYPRISKFEDSSIEDRVSHR